MNKSELVAALAEKTEISKAEAGRSVDALVAILSEQMAAGNTVSILGFGSFGSSQRAAREGKNPKTGEKLTIAARRAPKFTAGATLKKVVAG